MPPPIFELPLAFILGSEDSTLEVEEPLPEVVTSPPELPKTAPELPKEPLKELPKEPLNELPELPENPPDTLPEEPPDELPELPKDRVNELPKKPPDELPELPEDPLDEPPEEPPDEPPPLEPGRSSGVGPKSMSRLKKARNVKVVKLAMRPRVARRKESVNDGTHDVDCDLIVKTMYLKGVMLSICDESDVIPRLKVRHLTFR